jgi:hypothetical protein
MDYKAMETDHYNTSHFSAAAPIAKDSPLPKDFKTVSAIWQRGSRPPVTKQTTTTGATTGSSATGSITNVT